MPGHPLRRHDGAAPARWPRTIRVTALCSLLALLAAACGDGGTGDPAPVDEETTDAEETTQTPAAEQELIVGVGEDPWIDSEGDRKRRPNYPINADVCETLVALGTDFQVEPSIATDWEFVGDNTFEFTLRDDVTFADGTPVTAEDVKYSMDYTTEEPDIGGFTFIGPDSTTVLDEETVAITPEEPNLRLVEQINHPTFSILQPESDPLNDVEASTCTGPFEVTEYQAEEFLEVRRNENYWGEPAQLDQITFRFYADDTARALALQNGEVDMITDVPRAILSSIEQQDGIKIERAPIGQVMMMYVSRRDADESDRLMADPLVRRAASTAIDRESFVEGVLGGEGEVIPSVAPVEVFGDHADILENVPYDPEEAGQLLDEAGWTLEDGEEFRTKDGETLDLTIIYARIDLTVAEFVQSQLREVGFNAQVDQLDPGAYTDRLANGNYDLDISLPNQNDANPAFLLSLRWYSKARGDNAPWVSPGPDTEFDRLIDQTQEATETDELQRLAAEAMHELLVEEVGGISLAGTYQIFAMREEVQGFQPHPSGTNQRWSTVFIGE